MHEIEVNIDINVTNSKEFIQSAIDYGCSRSDTMEAMVKELVIAPDVSPSEAGYEIVSTEVKSTSKKKHTIVVCLNVIDEERLVKEAIKCYGGCWQDESWHPETIGVALIEIMCASNERPSPDTLGFEFADWTFPKNRPTNPEFIPARDDEFDVDEDEMERQPGL